MNTKELQSFLQVCKEKSFTKAAKILSISPQGLNKIIKKLEEEWNVTLFERTASGIALTEYGQVLEKRAKQILDYIDDIDQEFEEMQNTTQGTLKIASAYGVLNFFSPDCLLAFQEAYPNIALEYKEYPDKEVDLRVNDEEFDLGISIGAIDTARFETQFLHQNQLTVLMSWEHRFHDRRSLSFADLKDENFVIKNADSKIHDLILEKCNEWSLDTQYSKSKRNR